MNAELRKTYAANMQVMASVRTASDRLHGPFLISPSEAYCNAQRRLLIIGQQTNGWCQSDDVDEQLRCYASFDLGRRYYRSPFWRVFHKLERAILGAEYIAAWGNLNRFDFDGRRPPPEIEKRIATLDFLLVRELEILRPNICIWLVGPDFDQRLQAIFQGINIEPVDGWTTRQCCKMKHPLLPERTFRTYHPNALRLLRIEDRVIETIKNETDA